MRWKLYSSQLGIGNEDIFKWGYNKPDEYMTIDFIKEIFMEISYSGLILILIRYILDVYENYNSPYIGIGSCFTFIDTRTKKEHSRTLVDKNVRDLNPLAAMNKEISLFSVGKFFYKMKKNSRVSFSYRKKSYDFLVLSINNEKIQYPSESEIEEFHDKVLSVLKTGNDEFNKKYINIIRQMKIIRNSTSNSNLVYHLKKTIKELASRTGRMEKIINESKIRYKKSRENYVTLLSTKPRI